MSGEYRRAPSFDSILEYPRLSSQDVKKRVIMAIFLTLMISLGILCTLWYFGMFSISSKSLSQKEVALDYYSKQYNLLHGRRQRGLFSWKKMNAVILVLCRNDDIGAMLKTLDNFEARFNRKFPYPYVFLNDVPFDEGFKGKISALIRRSSGAKVEFGQVPEDHWNIPSHINIAKAEENWKDLSDRNVIYGGSKSYRQMCRYFSGFFFDHPLMKPFEYYWRLEPGVEFLCNIPYDPFVVMDQENKKYGYVITLHELEDTIPTLWEATSEFTNSRPELINTHNCLEHFIDSDGRFNNCHFWSNFEIAKLSFFRSPEYRAYFEHLDSTGGIFYERWGDAPIHSLAVGMFLKKDEVLFFDDIGYSHPPFQHCPADSDWRREQNCKCNPFQSNDMTHSECQHRWDHFDV